MPQHNEGGRLERFNGNINHKHKDEKAFTSTPHPTHLQGSASIELNGLKTSFACSDDFDASNSVCNKIPNKKDRFNNSSSDLTNMLDHSVSIEVIQQNELKYTFEISVDSILQRERDMKNKVKKMGFLVENWGGSLIYKKLKEIELDEQVSSLPFVRKTQDETSGPKNSHSQNHSLLIDLNDDLHSPDCRRESFEWRVQCIHSYYLDGMISIKEEYSGNDVLVTLDKFGIVYSHDQIDFQSFGCFLRVRMWSDYYRHRSAVMKWIQHSIMTSHSRYSYLFVTEPEPSKNIQIKLGNERCEVLDGGIVSVESECRKNGRSIPLSCTGK